MSSPAVDPASLRARLDQWEPELVKTLPPLAPTLTEEYLTIPSSKRIKITRPLTPSPTAPLILLFHGGGWSAGTIEQTTRPAREFAEAFGAVVIGASYKLIPEHPFPQGVEDAYETILWVARNARERWGLDLKQGGKFVVGGLSAGANISAALAPIVIERAADFPEGVKVTGWFIIIPLLLIKALLPQEYAPLWTSRVDNSQGAGDGVLTSAAVEAILADYKPDIHSPLFSPFNAPEQLVRQLPRTYLQAGGRDCLRDDAVVYERYLQAKGVEVRLDVSERLGHVGYSVFTQKGDEEELELKRKTMEAMKWLLRL